MKAGCVSRNCAVVESEYTTDLKSVSTPSKAATCGFKSRPHNLTHKEAL